MEFDLQPLSLSKHEIDKIYVYVFSLWAVSFLKFMYSLGIGQHLEGNFYSDFSEATSSLGFYLRASAAFGCSKLWCFF